MQIILDVLDDLNKLLTFPVSSKKRKKKEERRLEQII